MHWNQKHVLVTGAGGFIGSHLAERLVELGAQVRAFVHYNALGTWGWLDHSPLSNRMELMAGDICDRDSVRQVMEGLEIVFHLAALIPIPYSYRAPASFLRANVEGTLNILQTAREMGIERIVHTSTSEVYGTAQYVPIDEAHPLQAQSPYSASKIGADKLVEAFHLSFGLPTVSVRPFNTFGPRQSARAIIPSIISQCLVSDTVRLGSLHPTRDMNYVANTVEGFVLAASEPKAIGETINLGSGRELSIGNLAQLIIQLVNPSAIVESDPERIRPVASEVERLVADSSKATTLLGWRPTIDLETGLGLTIEWMREHLGGYRPYVYSI